MDKQKRQLKERLDAKRRARETAEYEEEAAVALVRNAEREHSFVLEKKQKEQLRQKDLVFTPFSLFSKRDDTFPTCFPTFFFFFF